VYNDTEHTITDIEMQFNELDRFLSTATQSIDKKIKKRPPTQYLVDNLGSCPCNCGYKMSGI